MIDAFTDYPITAKEFGSRGKDESGKRAPVRRVTILAYNRNKHCIVRVEGFEGLFDIKFGYMYKTSDPDTFMEGFYRPDELSELPLPRDLPEWREWSERK